jgi:hypothetical protein
MLQSWLWGMPKGPCLFAALVNPGVATWEVCDTCPDREIFGTNKGQPAMSKASVVKVFGCMGFRLGNISGQSVSSCCVHLDPAWAVDTPSLVGWLRDAEPCVFVA